MSSQSDQKADIAKAPAFDEVWGRVQSAIGINSLNALANELDITSASVAGSKKRGTFPLGWLYILAVKHNISLDYLIFGETRAAKHKGEGKIVYIDPALRRLVEEAIRETGIEVNLKQKQALIELVREELKSKTAQMLKVIKGV